MKLICNPILKYFQEADDSTKREFIDHICRSHTEMLCANLRKLMLQKCGKKRLQKIKKILDET